MQWASPVTKVKRLKVASKNDIKMPHLPEVAYWGQAKQDNKPQSMRRVPQGRFARKKRKSCVAILRRKSRICNAKSKGFSAEEDREVICVSA